MNREHIHPEAFGLLIDGSWLQKDARIEVRNPLGGDLIGTVAQGSAEDVTQAISAAAVSLREEMPAHERYTILMRAADLVEKHADEYAWIIAGEGSKTIREARREPPRTATLLRLSAEEGRRISGETLPFDSRVGSENRLGYYFRFPVGIVGAITPFNDPLAMTAHKVGPALAAGNAVVLKPATATPLSALRLARHLMEAGLPRGRLNIVTGPGEEMGTAIVTDPRVRAVSFTGGVATGEWISRQAGIKKLSMELGSNSPVIVLPDADMARAVPAISDGAFAQAGENCIGVQRVFIHEKIYDEFTDGFVRHASQLVTGSSLDEKTDVCAMISLNEAERVEEWVNEAVEKGALVRTGGHRDGVLFPPTVLEQVPEGVRLDQEEVYGPVVSLYRVASLEEAIEKANRVRYGLHAAIFTESLRDAFTAVKRLAVGGVIVNDSTDYRLDVMPFGGTKLSGVGREGIRFAVQEFTETRVVCFNL